MRLALTMNVGHGRYVVDELNHNYVAFFERMGAHLSPIPNSISDPIPYLDGLAIQGIVFTGGNDITPTLYNSSISISSNSEVRDRLEFTLMRYALGRDLPIVGICRGMQLINVYYGGGLVRNESGACVPTLNHVGRCHQISLVDTQFSLPKYRKDLVVNSYHNQMVTESTLSPDLRVFAFSVPDNVVEGLFHPNYPILGIQWHPERPGSNSSFDVNLIHDFLRFRILRSK